MLYSEARQHILSGDLIAYSGDSAVGRAIRMWTGATYSHVAIACWFTIDGVGTRLGVMESMEGKGVTIRALSGLGPFYWIATPGKWNEQAFEFAWGKVGVAKYDWTSIVRRVFGKDSKRDESYICSEMAGEVLVLQGLNILPHEFSDPGLLVDAALDCGGVMRKVIPDISEQQRQERLRAIADHIETVVRVAPHAETASPVG